MYQFKIPGVKLPKLFVCQTEEESAECQEHGAPYIMWKDSEDLLIKMALFPVLKKLLPYIKWENMFPDLERKTFPIVKVPGSEEDGEAITSHNGEYADIAKDYRKFTGEGKDAEDITIPEAEVLLKDYLGDLNSQVNIDKLQELRLLPTFIGDIIDCINTNLCNNLLWREGYNKKTRMYDGNWKEEGHGRNLIILDVSGSIPRGISATMVTLINTIRDHCNADLIITAGTSKFYSIEDELPSPAEILAKFGYGNECYQFKKILRDHIAGKHWDNIISFGDNDYPECFLYENFDPYKDKMPEVKDYASGTTIGALWNYHTTNQSCTGYLRWAREIAPEAEWHTSTEWCKYVCD